MPSRQSYSEASWEHYFTDAKTARRLARQAGRDVLEAHLRLGRPALDSVGCVFQVSPHRVSMGTVEEQPAYLAEHIARRWEGWGVQVWLLSNRELTLLNTHRAI